MEFVLRIILLFFVLAVGVVMASFAWWSFQEYLRYKEWMKSMGGDELWRRQN